MQRWLASFIQQFHIYPNNTKTHLHNKTNWPNKEGPDPKSLWPGMICHQASSFDPGQALYEIINIWGYATFLCRSPKKQCQTLTHLKLVFSHSPFFGEYGIH